MFEDLADGVAMALPYSINVHKLQWADILSLVIFAPNLGLTVKWLTIIRWSTV